MSPPGHYAMIGIQLKICTCCLMGTGKVCGRDSVIENSFGPAVDQDV